MPHYTTGWGLPPQKSFLFVDFRHIQAGHLLWSTPDGTSLPLTNPPPPQVEAQSAYHHVPIGIHLQAQPAYQEQRMEQGGYLHKTIYEDGLYCSWGLDYAQGLILYRESDDGYSWRHPQLEPQAFDGGHPNVVFAAPREQGANFDGFALMLDERAPASERYKLLYTAVPPKHQIAAMQQRFHALHRRLRNEGLQKYLERNEIRAMYGATSPDGLHWTLIEEPLAPEFADTIPSLYYDEWLERYVLYNRHFIHGRRCIGRAETDDFRRWQTGLAPIIAPTLDQAPYNDWYTNGRSEYPGEPGYHLMFPMLYHRHDESSDAYLYVSDDGVCWQQVPGGTVLRKGRPGAWDGEFIVPGTGLVPLSGDRVGLLYSGTPYPHKYPRWPGVLENAHGTAWATWQRGRLCAVVAEERGYFTTLPMRAMGRHLRLNLRTRRGGFVRVGLVTPEGEAIAGRALSDCAPLFGDALTAPVCWNGEDLSVPGEEVCLQFELCAAELFGGEWDSS